MLQVSMQRPLFGYLGLLVKHNALQSSCYLFSPLAKIFPEYQVIRTKKYFTDHRTTMMSSHFSTPHILN